MAKGWKWLFKSALHSDGFVGNCQPGGGSPENNFGKNSTSNFCTGQFLLAASQVSRMSAAAAAAAAAVAAPPPPAPVINVACVGDSITQGYLR